MDKKPIKPIVDKLYSIIREKAPKYCAKKCIDIVDECEEYILKNLSHDDWHSLQTFEGRNGAKPATFATTVIVSLGLRCLRDIKNVASLDEHQSFYANIPVFDLLMYDEVNNAVEQLDEMDRLIIILFYYDGYNEHEIASMMNYSMHELTTVLQDKFQCLARQLNTTTDEIINILKITPKKFADFKGNTSRHILDGPQSIY